LTTVSSLDIVNHDHTYCKKANTIEDLKEDQDRKTLEDKLKIKIKGLQQQLRPGADPGGIECSSRYGQIFPIMNTKIVLGKNSILIYFHAIHFCLQK
jgi:hypothetical protein